MTTVVALRPEPEALERVLDRAAQALIEARTDVERVRVRDIGRAAAAAAYPLPRRYIYTDAMTLIGYAEREIHLANLGPIE